MNSYRVLQNITLCAAFVLNVNPLFAATNIGSCPTVEELKVVTFDLAMPYGFDTMSQSMNFMALAEKSTRGFLPNFVLIVNPLRVAPNEDPEANFRALIDTLHLETQTPLSYRLADDFMQSMCVYTQPDNSKLTALVFLFPEGEYDNEGIGFGQSHAKHSKQQRALKLMKKFALIAGK